MLAIQTAMVRIHKALVDFVGIFILKIDVLSADGVRFRASDSEEACCDDILCIYFATILRKKINGVSNQIIERDSAINLRGEFRELYI